MSTQVLIQSADLSNPQHTASLISIIDSYARGPGGQNAPISDLARENMVEGLQRYGETDVLMAFIEGEAVGIAVCKWGFSTFAGKPYINIHDLAVLPEYRGKGIGRALMQEVERRARAHGCCKVSLEVHDSNEGAKKLYASEGFGPWEDRTLYVSKAL